MNRADLRHALGRHCIDGPDGLWVSPDGPRALAEVLHVLADTGAALFKDVQLSRANLRQLSAVSDSALTVDAGAGWTLQALEQQLAGQGVCLGAVSPGAASLTVGEYFESAYAGLHAVEGGRLEPLCTRLEVVLPDGSLLVTPRGPRSAAGPDLSALVLGAFGALGIVVSATLRLRPRPAARQDLAFSFPSSRALVGTLQAALSDGCLPGSARVLPGSRPSVVIDLRGDEAGVARDVATVNHHAFKVGGRPLSSSPAPAQPPPEREADWPAIEAAIETGAALELYRLSLGTCVVRGAVAGPALDAPAPWGQGEVLISGLDARGALRGHL